MTSQKPTRRAVVGGGLAALALSACSSAKKNDGGATDGEDVTKRLKAAQDLIGSTSGYHAKLTATGAPKEESSLEAGEGDVVNSPAAFKGDVTANNNGNTFKAGITSIGADSWVKPSFDGNYHKLNLTTLGVPNPTALFDAKTGLPALPLLSKDMKATGEKLVNGEKVSTFKGTVDGPTATKAMGFGKSRDSYTVEVGLTAKNEVRVMTIHGPFFDSADATYTINVSDYGKKTTITKP